MDKKVQEKIYLYQILKNQEELLSEQIMLLEQEIENSIITENVVKELENQKGNEIFASLGKDCFMRAELKENKILVNLGAGVLAKKSIPEARQILEKRGEELRKKKDELSQRLEKILTQIEKLEPEIQKLLTQKS